MKLLPFALALFTLAVCAPAAFAEEGEADGSSRFFDAYDRDGDGRVTPEELGAEESVFKLLDQNADGAITAEDLGAAKPRERPARRPGAGAGPGGPDAGPGRGNRGGDRGRDPAAMLERLQRMDKDGDGKVSREEYKGRFPFERLDRNGDGFLDAADRPDAPGGGGEQDGGPGRARPDRPDPREMMRRLREMDTDEDGRVSAEEYKGDVPFERLDRNSDGFLDREDRPEGRRGEDGGRGTGRQGPSPEQLRERFDAMDENGDGKVDATEAPRPEMVRHLDGNEDGAVDFEEFTKAAGRRGGRGDRGGPGGRGGARALARFDENGDGRVTRDEFPGPDERFDAMDRNGDGALTKADFERNGAGPDSAPTTPAGGLRLADLDRDGNGKVSRDEFDGDDDAWRRHDRNHDGWITPDEAVPGPAPAPAAPERAPEGDAR